jgi:hypothetical protein
MKLSVLIAAALLAASPALYAQAPKDDAHKGRRFDCSQAKDPKACEERAAKGREMMAKARKACEAKKGAEHSECMRKETCAQTKDAAKCEARAKEAMAKRDAARAACQGKQGDEYRACMREQRGRSHKS